MYSKKISFLDPSSSTDQARLVSSDFNVDNICQYEISSK